MSAARLHGAPLGAAETCRDPRALLPPDGTVAGATGAGGPGETAGDSSLKNLSLSDIASFSRYIYTYMWSAVAQR